MLKFVILALGVFSLVLWIALAPVQGQTPPMDAVTYAWGYARLGSEQLVCKALVSRVSQDPRYPEKPSFSLDSYVVDNHYCDQ